MYQTDLSWFTTDSLVDLYILTYAERYGISKVGDIRSKIDSSKKVEEFIQRLRVEKFKPGEGLFFNVVFSIPYFLFAKGETVGLGALLAIQKWDHLSEYEEVESNHELVNQFMQSAIFQAQKLKFNISSGQSFFDRYFINLSESYFELAYDPSEEIAEIYYSKKDDNNMMDILRFYKNKTVVHSSLSNSVDDLISLKKLVNKEIPNIIIGRYSLRAPLIEFRTVDAACCVAFYSGKFSSDNNQLLIHLKSNNSTKVYTKFSHGKLSKETFNASVAKAGSFSIKSAMINRI